MTTEPIPCANCGGAMEVSSETHMRCTACGARRVRGPLEHPMGLEFLQDLSPDDQARALIMFYGCAVSLDGMRTWRPPTDDEVQRFVKRASDG